MVEIYQALQLEALKALVSDVIKIALPIGITCFGLVQAWRLFKATARG